MSAIEKALLEATGQKPQKKGEDRQKYLLRLALASNNDLKEEEWDALEAEAGAQDWVTAAIKADNAKKALADFPDLEDEAEEEDDAAEEEEPEDGDDEGTGEDADEDEPEEGEEEEVAQTKANGKAKTGGKKPAAKKGAAKAKPAKAPAKAQAAKKPSAVGKGGKKPVSSRRAVKLMIIKKPSMTVDDIMEQLKAKGHDPLSKLTVNTTRSETRDTLKLLSELGHLKNVAL